MQKIAGVAGSTSVSSAAPGRLRIWNQRLLIASAVAILWAASILALQAAGPHARDMLAGEGMLINPPDQ
jgi:hypothetical protein